MKRSKGRRQQKILLLRKKCEQFSSQIILLLCKHIKEYIFKGKRPPRIERDLKQNKASCLFDNILPSVHFFHIKFSVIKKFFQDSLSNFTLKAF